MLRVPNDIIAIAHNCKAQTAKLEKVLDHNVKWEVHSLDHWGRAKWVEGMKQIGGVSKKKTKNKISFHL